MESLRISLLGSMKVVDQEGCSPNLGSPTTRALFAYLLLNRGEACDRRRLAFLFWPRGTEAAARRNLRQYLHRLRRALEPIDPQGELLIADGTRVQINPQADLWLDVEAFAHATRAAASLQELKAAIELYAGDLLEDLYGDWCLEERSRLRRTYLEALDRLSHSLQALGRPQEAIPYVERWVSAEPLDERAHCRLMALLAACGQRSRALQQYRVLSEILSCELQAEPLPESRALYQSILEGRFQPGQVPAPMPEPSPRPLAPEPLPLIGREAEMARLGALLEAARAGSGAFVLITGDPGIGKSRLVQEHLQVHAGLPHLHKECHELEAMIPYGALRPLVRQALDALPRAALDPPPAWLAALARLIPGLIDPFPATPWATASTGPQLSEAFTELLHALHSASGGEAIHLVLDDVHWADNLTWEFLGHLSRHLDGLPLLILALGRLEDLPADRGRFIRMLQRHELVETIRLPLLTQEQTVALAAHLLGTSQVDPLFLQRLYQETEGNPLFVIETVRALQESRRAPALSRSAGGRLDFSLPLSIRRVIEARLERLEPESQELLATAAVIGRRFNLSLLEEVSQASARDIVRYIEEWTRRGLVREVEGDFSFSHERMREAAQSRLSNARRQYLHRRVADVLRDVVPPADPATLAHFYAHSDQPLKALPYFTRAGEQALRMRSYQEAHQFGRRALSLLGRMPGPRQQGPRVDLNLQLAQAHAFAGELERALQILSEAEHLAASLGDPLRQARVFHRSAQVYWLRGQPEVAGDYARRALRLAEEHDLLEVRWDALRMVGRVSIALAAFDDAIAYLQQYLRDAAGGQSPPVLPVIYGYLGVAYARVGSWARALEAATRGMQKAEAEGSAHMADVARLQLAFVHAARLDWPACLETLQGAVAPLSDIQDLTPHGFMLRGLYARALAHLGRAEEALRTLPGLLAWAQATGYRAFEYLPRLFLAEAHAAAGNLDQASDLGERVLERSLEVGDRWARGITLRLLADVRVRGVPPDWTRAEDHLIESMRLLREIRARPDLARTHLALRRLYDRAGQMAWAVDCHFRAMAIFEELGMSQELQQAQGRAARGARGAVVIPGLKLRGPNAPAASAGS